MICVPLHMRRTSVSRLQISRVASDVDGFHVARNNIFCTSRRSWQKEYLSDEVSDVTWRRQDLSRGGGRRENQYRKFCSPSAAGRTVTGARCFCRFWVYRWRLYRRSASQLYSAVYVIIKLTPHDRIIFRVLKCHEFLYEHTIGFGEIQNWKINTITAKTKLV